MSFMKLIKMDLEMTVKSQKIHDFLKVIFLSHTFHLVLCIRIGQAFRKIPLIGGFLGLIIEYFIRIFFSSDISCKSKISGGLVIVHGHDIVIGAEVVINENCKIFNGVTLGNKDTESLITQQPIVGKNVVLGTGCKVLGNIKIGDHVKVGANSVVITDIPDNSIAVGVPAKVISR